MNKAKVLYVAEALGNGGIEKVMLNYVDNFDRDKVDVEFLIVKPDINYYEDYLISKGFKINYLNRYNDLNKSLRKFFKGHKYDIVHIHAMSTTYVIFALYAKIYGTRCVVFHSHNSNFGNSTWKFKVAKKFINVVTNYKFACSREAGKYMFHGKFNVINNAIALENYRYSEEYRKEIRERHGISNDTLLLGNIGRLEEQKNQKYLIKVLKETLKTIPEAKALIVGSGQLEEELREYAIQQGVENKIIFALNRSDAYKYYSAFDVLLLTSIFEGFSVVLVEAQANGLPIIYSKCLTDEAKLLENVVQIPIDDEHLAEWVDTINLLQGTRLDDTVSAMMNKGYDIISVVSKIEQFYVDIVNCKKLPKCNL